jgi:aldehyde:ferredoxin oxidoreductase
MESKLIAKGFTGKILHVDITKGTTMVEEPGEAFYRMYMGGPGIGIYYLLHEKVQRVDPLGPDNVLVFAPGLLTGTQSPCVPRFTVCARSPLTGALGKSEAGGYWGPQLKRAGFDAVVVRGQASYPVYLWIKNGIAEIRSAERIWTEETGVAQDRIRAEVKESRAQIAQIGPGGENLVRFACITNDLSHFNGRNGLGAVMGSKKLRAIATYGSTQVPVVDGLKIKEIFRWSSDQFKTNPLTQTLHNLGTPAGIATNNALGVLPTNNWQRGFFPQASEIGADKLAGYLISKGGCFACPLRCKRVVSVNEPDFQVDSRYGGPEYETLVMFGSNCGIFNLRLICKANELCNRLGIDTISAGMTISFAMQCFENGILTIKDTDGMELRFGNEKVLLPLIEQIAYRRGFGALLSDGSRIAAEKIGNGSEAFLMEVKGQEVPGHDPRVKTGMGIQYVVAPNGADHWFSQHDPFFASADSPGLREIAPLGIFSPIKDVDLDTDKARFVLYGAFLTFLYDLLGACVFGFVGRGAIPLSLVLDLVVAVTGWNTSFWELMKAGERVHTMARVYNNRCGMETKDDKLPDRYFSSIQGESDYGHEGLNREAFTTLVRKYYAMAGWDIDGKPLKGKLYELGLGWLSDDGDI